MLTIDGSRYSGSGTIVRQAVAFSALTGKAIHMVNARAKRDQPGLRPQHIRVVEAIAELVNGRAEGLTQGSQEFTFRPGSLRTGRHYRWDIGSAGSTTMLALGILPVLAFAVSPVSVELRGGLFQDFAPSAFHLQQVLLPMLHDMGLRTEVEIGRPGYVPRGDGILRLAVQPLTESFRALTRDNAGPVMRVWGIALSSHLEERHVSRRMADTARDLLAKSGYRAEIELRHDTEARQRGAALALFADRGAAIRLGADQAGALRRSAESIGRHVCKQLLDDLASGATLDRFAADQIIPFAALAEGESRFIIPAVTDHVLTSGWLAEVFLGAHVRIDGQQLTINGVGFRPDRIGPAAPPITRFMADAMLGRLARWLRILGYDTAYEKDSPDERLIDRTLREDRWLLTRDGYLTQRKVLRGRHTLIVSDDLQAQLRQLRQDLKLDLEMNLRRGYRCADCNAALLPIPHHDAAPLVPAYVAEQHREFLQCPDCRRIFWPGTHRDNVLRRLDAMNETDPD